MSAKAPEAAPSLHDFMSAANATYYGSRDPLGASGDFITAPEISQMFGELVGLWAADLWHRAGAPTDTAYVELGPGRGTLAADAMRAMARAGLTPPVHLVETSPTLRSAQAERVPAAQWHNTIDTLPADRPLLIVANEFFDALPIRQFVRTGRGWREHLMMDGRLVAGEADCAAEIPVALADAPLGAIVEQNPAAETIMATLAARLARQGGAFLIVDYGYEGPATGDTLQAVMNHRFADPLAEPGSRDLTAHVDFSMLAMIARAQGLLTSPVVGQGMFLKALGIDARAQALARANPARSDTLFGQRDRLTKDSQMGRLFKVLAVRHADWPMPAGFA
ncbi:class I SAM-dependent methyltransferase [Sphingobium sp. CR28]|uniref:class I SAM-dependent methyltransferase n=1 Tax=Sphingobium sp. CR28 TaxID=3400272 RepID=UPI003FEDDF0D